MPIYCVSLKHLGSGRPADKESPDADASPTDFDGRRSEAAFMPSNTLGSPSADLESQPPAPLPNEAGVSAADTLNLSAHEIQEFLSQMGHASGKVILGLIHRLAKIETHLADIRSRMTGGIGSSAFTSEIDFDGLEIDAALDDNKSQLLAQLFQKNLLLRRM